MVKSLHSKWRVPGRVKQITNSDVNTCVGPLTLQRSSFSRDGRNIVGFHLEVSARPVKLASGALLHSTEMYLRLRRATVQS